MQGRGESIPGGNYDIIFSNYVLHRCNDKDLVFKEVHKHLRKGGKFGFVTWLTHAYCEVTPNFSKAVSPEFENAVRILYHPPVMEEYKCIISNDLFKILHVEEKEREWNFGNVHHYIKRLKDNFNGVEERAVKNYYGEGDVLAKVPYCIMVLQKL